MQALLPSSSICAASRRVSCNRMAMLVLPRRGDFSTSRFPFFPFSAKHLIARKQKQACLKKPSAFADFLKIRSPQRSSIFKLEKMGKQPFWRKLPFMTKHGRETWCRKSCDTIDIADVLDICHRSPFILVWSLGPPKSTYLTHPSILLQVPVCPFVIFKNHVSSHLQASSTSVFPMPASFLIVNSKWLQNLGNNFLVSAEQNEQFNQISNFTQSEFANELETVKIWIVRESFWLSAGRLSHFIHDVDPVTWNSRRERVQYCLLQPFSLQNHKQKKNLQENTQNFQLV